VSIKQRLLASALVFAVAACGGGVDVNRAEAPLEQALQDDVMPVAGGKSADATTTVSSIVVPILLIPQGSSVTSVQQTTLTQALGNVRRWYARSLPNKIVKWDSLRILHGAQTAAHYLTNNNVWAEMPGEIQAAYGWSPWDTGDNRHIALVIGKDLMGWAGGAGYSDGRGIAILGLESLADQAPCSGNWWCTQEIWHGTAIHELGHGFSLNHDTDPLSIMNFHGDYTNKYFIAADTPIVEASPAVQAKLANWSGCTTDFTCATERCGGNWGNQLQCLPSTAYPKEAGLIPNGSYCRTSSQCQSGHCELIPDGFKVCAAAPLPQYVTPFFPDLTFTWSSAGPVPNQLCTQISEPSDPDTWSDNYLCSNAPHELQWSYAGSVPNLRCTTVNEPAEPVTHAWGDNNLCVPTYSPFQLQWSYAGPVSGKACIRFLETADPHTWSDNYLCY